MKVLIKRPLAKLTQQRSRLLSPHTAFFAGAAAEVPILAESATLAKRRADEEADVEARRAAKKQRQEMKQLGHMVGACV